MIRNKILALVLIGTTPFMLNSSIMSPSVREIEIGAEVDPGSADKINKSSDRIKSFDIGATTVGVVLNEEADAGTDDLYISGTDAVRYQSSVIKNYYITGLLAQGEDEETPIAPFGDGIEAYSDPLAKPIDIDRDGITNSQAEIEDLELGSTFSGAILKDDGVYKVFEWGSDAKSRTIPEIGWDKKDPSVDDSNNVSTIIDITGNGTGELKSIRQFTIGYDHAGAILDDGTGEHIYTWGMNREGYLGLGLTSGAAEYPTAIDDSVFSGTNPDGTDWTLSSYESLEFGHNVSYAIVKGTDGNDHLFAWGDNSESQLGFTDISAKGSYYTPTELYLNTDETPYKGSIDQISIGLTTSYALTTDKDGQDHIFGWGNNDMNQLGTSADISRPFEQGKKYTPSEINFRDGAMQLSTTDKVRDMDIDDEGKTVVVSFYSGNEKLNHIYSWGDNTNGQIGSWENTGHKDTYALPQDLDINNDGIHGTSDHIISVVSGAGATGTLFETEDGSSQTLYMWGDNSDGKFGFGDSNKSSSVPPVAVWSVSTDANSAGTQTSDKKAPKWIKITTLVFTILAAIFIIVTVVL